MRATMTTHMSHTILITRINQSLIGVTTYVMVPVVITATHVNQDHVAISMQTTRHIIGLMLADAKPDYLLEPLLG